MPDKKPEKINSNTSSFLNTASQFFMGFSPNVASRAISANLDPASKSKRRQEYGLNQTTTSAPEAPSAPSAPPPTSSTPAISPKPSSPPQKREKQQSAVTIDLSTFAKGAVPMSATSNFTTEGAISIASGGKTNYAAGLGLADTSGLKAEKSFTAPTSSRKEARQEKRATRLENRMAVQTAKGKAAAGDGRFIDANNKQGRVQNLQKRIDRLRK